ncbi:dihydroorotase, multifunctional complex type [Desulfotomaculum nigrificans CO-1-SRB]|uniref:Dihydroorotase n=1 Tax=Desulfotomaculum nigrificans (strain DSM 14880 / VKM B-2319 / CO-1-SRB) TaxID=868595 RepID=F6B466_DESCC|nr:dihydroorotase [Desulfotomaculum nigrificans]AEF94121.1 dihydroorotase, multifunctional complex type [Desulfotomaculum nigrificans CO-1-SRB]
MQYLIKGGIVVDPVAATMQQLDLLVDQGLVVALGTDLVAPEAVVIDAVDRYVCPGFFDLHVHLREPGYEYKEDIASGTRAAAMGGFTAVACMPNTNPVADNAAVISYILEKARQAATRVYPIGAMTKGSQGQELTEMADLKAAGAVALSDDGKPVMDAGLMRRIMQYAGMLGLPVISHCEDINLAAGGQMHEGAVATMLGLKGIPAAAEEVMVARDILLAEHTGCRLHLAHISTAGSVRLVRQAKERGVKVTAEATPHHFTLTEDAVQGFNTNAKVNPPLRRKIDVEAIKEGLADGTIDVIATDHAPHAYHEKDVEFQYAPTGLIGLETAVGLVFTELVQTGILTVPQAVAKLSYHPRRVLGLDGGVLEPGAVADITIIDPNLTEIVDPGKMQSKSKNTPFTGWRLTGLPVITMVAGKIIMQERQLRIENVLDNNAI